MPSKIPNHIAIIPDGNRRWATLKGVTYAKAYIAGTEATRECIEAAVEAGVSYLTIWAASEDNLTKRSPVETRGLRTLFRRELARLLTFRAIKEHGIRVRVIGKYRELLKDEKINSTVDALHERTKDYTGLQLTILLGYDGKREMVEAVKKIVRSKIPVAIDTFSSTLWTHMLPSVDFVIRTGGDEHWSAGFMMWLTANSELYFSKLYWPSFRKKEFRDSLADYASRRRMLGA